MMSLSVALFSLLFSFNLWAGFSADAESYLKWVRTGGGSSDFRSRLKKVTSDSLALELHHDNTRKAFWLNVYNGLVQEELRSHPQAYKQRNKFFRKKILALKDVKLSLNDIEHGILRRSKSLYSLGYFDHFFIEPWEKRLRVEVLDPRIHFSLNCGAESCPAILFYDESKIDRQLDLATRAYLTADVSWDERSNTANISRLFFWFNGDFGGRQGIVQFLNKFLESGINKNTNFHYKSYDWDLALSKYGDT